MSGRNSTVKVSFLGDSSQLNRVAKQAGDQAGKVGGAFAGMGKTIAGGFAVFAGVSVLKGFISEAEESRKVGNLTAQVIKSTGSAAKVTAGQVGDLATAISNKTGIDDEAIQSASNLLLTFTNVRNEVGKGNDIFNQATQAATDMGVALGQDPKASAIQLGKALNDPIKGVTALSEVGVSFTQQQKDQIKTLVKSGKTLDAQKIILKELGTEFGGAAAAAASPSQKLGVIVGNLKESIGTALLPVVDKFANFLGGTLIPALRRLGPIFSAVGKFVKTVADVFYNGFVVRTSESTGALGKVETAGRFLGDTFDKLKPIIARIAGFIQANFIPALQRIGAFMTGTVFPAIAKVAGFLITTFTPTFRALSAYITGTVVPAWQKLAQKISENIGPVMKVAGAILFVVAKIAGFLLPIIIKLAGFLGGMLFAVIGKVIGIIGGLARGIIGIVTAGATAFGWMKKNWPLLLAILTGPVGLAVLYISKHWDSIIGTIKGLPGRISSAASGMWDGIKDAFRGAINWIIRAWNNFSIGMPSISIPFGPDIPGFSINTPNISELANGTRGARGGMTLVGERGPELVDMPGGSKVTSNAALRRGGSGGDTVLHVNFVLDGRVMQTELLRLKRTLGGELGIA